MAEIWHETPIGELGLSTQAPRTLTEAGIETVGQLLEHTREQIADLSGMGAARLNDIDDALERRGLSFSTKLPSRATVAGRVCTDCPTCETCDNPRATEARNVVTDMHGNACHVGPRDQPPCAECQAHHRELVAEAARLRRPAGPVDEAPAPAEEEAPRPSGRRRKTAGAA